MRAASTLQHCHVLAGLPHVLRRLPRSGRPASLHSTFRDGASPEAPRFFSRSVSRAPPARLSLPRPAATPPSRSTPSPAPFALDDAAVLRAAGIVVAGVLLLCPAALAADAGGGVVYNPEAGSDTLKTVAGVAYIGLVIVYFVRLFKKRADRATSVRLASMGSDSEGKNKEGEDDDDDDDDDEAAAAAAAEDAEVTPLQCFV